MNKCNQKSVFETITDYQGRQFLIDNLSKEDIEKINTKLVISILSDYPSSHISINKLLEIILYKDKNLDYMNRYKDETKDVTFYSDIMYRAFLPLQSTNTTIKMF